MQNLTDLDNNLQNELFNKLSGEEIVKLCNSSVENRKVCQKPVHNAMWIRKLREEFGVNYEDNDAYLEYLRQLWLSSQTFWLYFFSNGEDDLLSLAPKVFRTKESALKEAKEDIYEVKLEPTEAEIEELNSELGEYGEAQIRSDETGDYAYFRLTETRIQ